MTETVCKEIGGAHDWNLKTNACCTINCYINDFRDENGYDKLEDSFLRIEIPWLLKKNLIFKIII